jgi:Uma2 family endonuclease
MHYPYPTDAYTLHEDFGVYAPKDHQRIIGQLTIGLGNLYYGGQIDLEALPETMLAEGQASPVPDLILYANETATTPVIIEVCHTEGLRHDCRKVAQLIDGQDYGIREGFVYDYRAGNWYQYRLGTGWLAEAPSVSAVLGQDLARFLR